MTDREKVIEGLEKCRRCDCDDCTEENASHCPWDCVAYDGLVGKALAMLKEQEKLINADELREKLGIAKDCARCKQNSRSCQYDSHFSLMDFCEMLDMAIEELT